MAVALLIGLTLIFLYGLVVVTFAYQNGIDELRQKIENTPPGETPPIDDDDVQAFFWGTLASPIMLPAKAVAAIWRRLQQAPAEASQHHPI